MELVIKIIINIIHIVKKLCKSRILLERMVFNWHFKSVQWKYVASNTRFASKFILHWQPHKYGVCAKFCLDQQLSKKHLVSCFESIIQIFHSHFTYSLCPAGRCASTPSSCPFPSLTDTSPTRHDTGSKLHGNCRLVEMFRQSVDTCWDTYSSSHVNHFIKTTSGTQGYRSIEYRIFSFPCSIINPLISFLFYLF